ncbi:MAG: DNA polymerase Y family protein [bacterium]|nr:DNA polymerase Y family protein [bacterium]
MKGQPVAIATGGDARAEIISASPEARALGLTIPCSMSHARSLSSKLVVRVTSPALESTTREALVDLALSFSPRVALAKRDAGIFLCEGAVFLDASGVASLYRSEAGFASALSARAQALGLPGPIAIASSRAVARIMARKLAIPTLAQAQSGEPECAILETSEEARVLAPLPIDLLDPGDELAQQLTRFGVHSVRDLLALPHRGLAARLGPDVLGLIARAQGREVEPPLPEPRDTRLREAMDLDHPIEMLEPLSFVLRGMLSRLTERLVLRGLASGPIDLALELCGGGRDHRRIGVAAPTRDHRVLLRLVVQALEARPARAPIESIALHTEGRIPRSDQLDLFRTPGPDPAEIDRTLAELEALCGPGQVGAPAVVDDNHPCAFELKPFRGEAENDTTPPSSRWELGPDGAPLAVRALRPPVRAEIQVHQGRPGRIRSAVACGDILNVAGPWRTTGRWWTEEGRFALDHFDVQVSDATILRLCFDWIRRDWQIDAIYD